MNRHFVGDPTKGCHRPRRDVSPGTASNVLVAEPVAGRPRVPGYGALSEIVPPWEGWLLHPHAEHHPLNHHGGESLVFPRRRTHVRSRGQHMGATPRTFHSGLELLIRVTIN